MKKYYVECGESKLVTNAEDSYHAAMILLDNMTKQKVETFTHFTNVSERGFHKDLIEVGMGEETSEQYLTVDIVEDLCEALPYEESEELPDLVGHLQTDLFDFFDNADEDTKSMILGLT
jgi:hypothetical protein